MNYIDNESNLKLFIDRASKSDVLAIDTEFIREKTYFPKLCLLQMATEDEVVIVDAMQIKDITSVAELLTNEHIVKIFHAAKQDIEILHHETGVFPNHIFDTQLAAAILGKTFQMGLGNLVHSFLGINLKKGDSFTDWTRRPLADSQLKYAAEDVIYLPELYKLMKEKLVEKGRLNWLDNDLEALVDPNAYSIDPYLRYRKLKRINQLDAQHQSAAREVAAWREIKAQKLNVPRKWVLTDEQIVEACRKETTSINELFLIRGVKESLSTKDARKVVELIKLGLSQNETDWPVVENANYCEQNVDGAIDLMMALTRYRAKENDIALQTLASQSDLTAIARGHFDDIETMHGWRRKIVGDELLELLDGKIKLSIEDGELKIDHQ